MSDLVSYHAVPVESVPVDVSLAYSVYVKIDGKFILLRQKDDVLEESRVRRLMEKNVTAAYVQKADWTAFVQSLESALNERGMEGSPEVEALGVRSLIYAYWKTLEERGELTQPVYEKLSALAQRMPIAISKDRALAFGLLKRASDPSMYFANHAVNTAIYSISVGLKLGLTISQLQTLTLAASVCNIGILKVPKEILYKAGPLLEEEKAIVEKHVQYGEEILKLLLAAPEVVRAVAQHHERMDGKGYPKGLKGQGIDLYARIITIGETYSALTSACPWRPAVSPTEALENMNRSVGKFDPEIFQV